MRFAAISLGLTGLAVSICAGQSIPHPRPHEVEGMPARYRTEVMPSTASTDQILSDLLPGKVRSRLDRALETIRNQRDERFIAPLLDVLRFIAGHRLAPEVMATLRELTGLELADRQLAWRELMAWYAAAERTREPRSYLHWKGEFYARMVDPEFRRLFSRDVRATVRIGEIVWGGVAFDGLPPLNDPKMIPAKRARYLAPTEPVFGVSINGDARAYPLRILDCHEMANDVVGGVPVSLAYCTLCGAGILYEAKLDDERMFFRSSGFLFRSNKLMCDTRTYSLWNHMTGEPVVGKLCGSGMRLKVLPMVLTSWRAWTDRHPETTVLSQSTGHRLPYRLGAYYGRYHASPEPMFPASMNGDGTGLKERIFVLRDRDRHGVYPIPELRKAGGVVNDALDDLKVVVVMTGRLAEEQLPMSWRAGVERLAGLSSNRHGGVLDLAAAQALLRDRPALVNDLSAEQLLSLPVDVRLWMLSAFSSPRKEGSRSRSGRLSADFRNEVALRGLIAEVRAYERGSRVFSRGGSDGVLVDQCGETWRVTETALVSSKGEDLPRLSGHLAYWFGWNAFYGAEGRTQPFPSYGFRNPSGE